ncbi:glycosyltransferase family 2 protein [Argonema antarcticum]|uniref:glycosyltransferase family 2 protein n=1 Tax=Argonema antarcticum TaxID=2942763 RepID=UPI002013B6D5|nr:glycosyltransferase family 2 protein [Argonema antarcticum]MCL1469338.1 glycosyltransferase family 2 protein [Argonema antarcticum A004/B2]
MSDAKLAILIACHNRREKTLACLQGIYEQNVISDVYLVDDGSTDGTSDAVRNTYPAVKLLEADGNLFWGGGMRLAFAEASKIGYNYYVWLNDDIELSANALSHLLETHRYLKETGKPDSIVVGSLRDRTTGKITYGGRVRLKKWRPLKFELLEPGEKPLECDTMNGNCVLIPRAVAENVGSVDPVLTHRRGDFDYGLRAGKLGCSIWVASGYVGTCSRNPIIGTWMDANLPLSDRLKKLNNPKELSSKEWTLYAKRYGGPVWFLYWLSPYLNLFISSALQSLKPKT